MSLHYQSHRLQVPDHPNPLKVVGLPSKYQAAKRMPTRGTTAALDPSTPKDGFKRMGETSMTLYFWVEGFSSGGFQGKRKQKTKTTPSSVGPPQKYIYIYIYNINKKRQTHVCKILVIRHLLFMRIGTLEAPGFSFSLRLGGDELHFARGGGRAISGSPRREARRLKPFLGGTEE